MLIKSAAILVIGPPVAAEVIFEVLLNASSMFNHGNVRLPAAPGPTPALGAGDAGHAPGTSLGGARRDQLQLRLQPIALGPALRHLPRPAPGRPRGHDGRHSRPPRTSAPARPVGATRPCVRARAATMAAAPPSAALLAA